MYNDKRLHTKNMLFKCKQRFPTISLIGHGTYKKTSVNDNLTRIKAAMNIPLILHCQIPKCCTITNALFGIKSFNAYENA